MGPPGVGGGGLDLLGISRNADLVGICDLLIVVSCMFHGSRC